MICIFPNTCIYTRLFCWEHTPCLEKSKVMKKNFLIRKYNLQNLDVVCGCVCMYTYVCERDNIKKCIKVVDDVTLLCPQLIGDIL